MQINNEGTWNWSDELDALIVAPQHHKLLLENEVVRVIDSCILPGQIAELHRHRWPALAPHALKNVGDKDLHIISVEIKA